MYASTYRYTHTYTNTYIHIAGVPSVSSCSSHSPQPLAPKSQDRSSDSQLFFSACRQENRCFFLGPFVHDEVSKQQPLA